MLCITKINVIAMMDFVFVGDILFYLFYKC